MPIIPILFLVKFVIIYMSDISGLVAYYSASYIEKANTGCLLQRWHTVTSLVQQFSHFSVIKKLKKHMTHMVQNDLYVWN